MRYIMAVLLLISGGYASAHQWLPTYPELEPSFVPGILRVRMELFNNRKDVKYYELLVYDAEFKPIKFAAKEQIIEIDYLRRKNVEIFIREQDRHKVKYVCSKSKLLKGNGPGTVVSSRICSKIK